MKKFSIILLILLNTAFYAQTTAPQLINYQGVARDVNGNPIVGPIGVRFHLHQTTANGTIVFTEVHSPTTNIYGIFNVLIGSNNPSQFASITWGTDDYFLEVQMDPTGATSYSSIGSQKLVSVPYALYAKNAGNSASYNAGSNITFTGPANNPTINSNPSLSLAGNVLNISGSGSPVTLPTVTLTATPNVTVSVPSLNTIDLKVPNYVAGTNVTITPAAGNNFVIDAGTGTSTSVATPYSLSVNGPHTVTPGPFANLTIVAPNLSVTGGGGTVVNNTLPNYAINIPTVVVTPTTGGLSFSQNGNTSTVAVGGGGQWTNTGPIVHLITGSNNVGIGTTNSTAKLTVTTSLANDAILAQSSGANGILAMTSSGGTVDAGVSGNNNGSGFGVKGQTSSTNSAVSGVIGTNNGIGNGVLGITGSSSVVIAGVKGINNSVGSGVAGENVNFSSASTAHGVRGETNGSNPLAAGVFGNNSNAGSGVYGINGSATPASTAHGVKGVTSNGGALATGVTGINTNVGTGVFGEHSNNSIPSGDAHGVYGKTNGISINAYGVYGENIGNGSGVYGLTSSSLTNAYGVYGKSVGGGDGVRGETGASNATIAAVSGFNNGTGVALKGSLPTGTVPGGSNVALLLENGHIKAIGSSVTVSSFSVSFIQSATHNIVPNPGNNDVRGIVTYTTNQTATAGVGTFVNINTTFSKIYSSPPVVVISCMNSNLQGWELQLAQINNSFFAVRAVNNSGGSASPPANITFSYIVIE